MTRYDFNSWTDATAEGNNLAAWIRNGGTAGGLLLSASEWVAEPHPHMTVTDSLLSWWAADLIASTNQHDLPFRCGMFIKAMREAHNMAIPDEDWG